MCAMGPNVPFLSLFPLLVDSSGAGGNHSNRVHSKVIPSKLVAKLVV